MIPPWGELRIHPIGVSSCARALGCETHAELDQNFKILRFTSQTSTMQRTSRGWTASLHGIKWLAHETERLNSARSNFTWSKHRSKRAITSLASLHCRCTSI